MKKFLALLLLAIPLISACSVVQPMVDGVKNFFADDKPAETAPPAAAEQQGAAPRMTYDQAAVECNQEASKPGATGNFAFCMRAKGWAPR